MFEIKRRISVKKALFVIFYISIFEILHIDMKHFFTPVVILVICYFIFKRKIKQGTRSFSVFDADKTNRNIFNLLTYFLFFGYYFWKINVFTSVQVFLLFPLGIIFKYFWEFEETTNKRDKFDK